MTTLANDLALGLSLELPLLTKLLLLLQLAEESVLWLAIGSLAAILVAIESLIDA